jgi:hypothetical protein
MTRRSVVMGVLLAVAFGWATQLNASGLIAFPADGGPIGVCDLKDIAYVNDSGMTCGLTEKVNGVTTYGTRTFPDQSTQERIAGPTESAAGPGDVIVISITDPATGDLIDDVTFTVTQC